MSSASNDVAVDNEPAPGVYAARRSQRVSTDLAPSDGNVWQEKLAVCEGVSTKGEAKLLIRSFYSNCRTKERVWDEPPSGAGTVLHATSEMRKTAAMQMEELQLTLEMIPPDEEDVDGSTDKSKTEKKGFFGRFRKKKERKQVETSKDLNLQRAIARSMADQMHGSSDEPIVYYDGETSERQETADDDEDIALAKALSMSEVAAAQVDNGDGGDALTEEEMFQRALEKSRFDSWQNDATGVARMPSAIDDSFSSFTMPPHANLTGTDDPNDSDRKLPAVPLQASSGNPPMKFDPYGK